MPFKIVEKTPILRTSDLTKTNHCWNKDWRAWNKSSCLCPKPGAILLLGTEKKWSMFRNVHQQSALYKKRI